MKKRLLLVFSTLLLVGGVSPKDSARRIIGKWKATGVNVLNETARPFLSPDIVDEGLWYEFDTNGVAKTCVFGEVDEQKCRFAVGKKKHRLTILGEPRVVWKIIFDDNNTFRIRDEDEVAEIIFKRVKAIEQPRAQQHRPRIFLKGRGRPCRKW